MDAECIICSSEWSNEWKNIFWVNKKYLYPKYHRANKCTLNDTLFWCVFKWTQVNCLLLNCTFKRKMLSRLGFSRSGARDCPQMMSTLGTEGPPQGEAGSMSGGMGEELSPWGNKGLAAPVQVSVPQPPARLGGRCFWASVGLRGGGGRMVRRGMGWGQLEWTSGRERDEP